MINQTIHTLRFDAIVRWENRGCKRFDDKIYWIIRILKWKTSS